MTHRTWLWAYLGPLFLLPVAPLCHTPLLPLVALVTLPATILWRYKGLVGSALVLGGALLLIPSELRLWHGGFSLLAFGAAYLSLQTLSKIGEPLTRSQQESKERGERLATLEAHLKEVHRAHLEEVDRLEGRLGVSKAQEGAMRSALNALRCAAYQQELDLGRLHKQKPAALLGQLKQLRNQFHEKDEELHKARGERYEVETRLLELERRFEEERLEAGRETFWVTPTPPPPADAGELEALVGDLLSELKSRCVPMHTLDLSVLTRKS
ncbi:MAG: hypothetical protein AB7F31_06700 [Parachlamydiales bacterium]